MTTEQAAQPVCSSENPELQPTTDEIIQICPWLKQETAKAQNSDNKKGIFSLVSRLRNLTSHDKSGEANINTEFISQQNDGFVIHDSK
ncbi:hypothetical protein DEU56DRAFT_902129, partial [Suillus clintonianus]|uniref:uncharacterized protein n=1 Tax=Suillus clintonianus TaxID=1904413 RepID=UPI001B86CDD0